MLLANRWVRRRARRLCKAFPYISRKEAILSAIEDHRCMFPKECHVINGH